MSLAFLDAARGATLIPELSPRAELALLARALYRVGYDDFNIGHMTYKQPDDTFLILPAEFGWDEARPEDLLRVDMDANILEGAGTVTPPIVLHMEYHKLHPDCIWTVHQHPRYATVWAAVGRIPKAYAQKGTELGDQIGLYDDYEGSVEGIDAARAAAVAVGDKKAVLLRNHGVFVVGDDVRQVFSRAVSLEVRCRVAWHVEAIGGGREMPEYGQRALVELGQKKLGNRAPGLWEWAVRRELRADPTLLGS
jgi:ribulose-5-phosphate 4-epimerase/fuculose-1-phosphate aldolase